jgi:TPR repeat protein
MWLPAADAQRLDQLARWTAQSRPQTILSFLEEAWMGALRDAAKRGHRDAQAAFANTLRYHDPQEARSWFEKAAMQGVLSARHNLALIDHAGGKQELAASAMVECADAGIVESQYTLGLWYLNGSGLLQSYELAHKWLDAAIVHRHQSARLLKGVLLCAGFGLPVDYESGLLHIRGAKRSNTSDAELFLVSVLATDPNARLRKGRSALYAAARLVQRRSTPMHLSALATAQAEAKLFDEAVMTQWRVVRLLRSRRSNESLGSTEAKSRLELYMKEKEFRAKTTAFSASWTE